jgi:cytochrome P450
MSTVVIDDKNDLNGGGEFVLPEGGPPNPPRRPDGGRNWQDIAARVLAPGRGIPRSRSWYKPIADAAVSLLKRLVATPLVIAGGTLVCLVVGLRGLILGASWRARLWSLLALVGSPLVGAFLGARVAWTGVPLDGPLIARILHRLWPIVALSKPLSHNLFGLTFVTRHADVKAVLAQGNIFRVDIYNERMQATSGAFFLGMGPGADYDREKQLGQRGVGRDLTRCRNWVRSLSGALIAQSMRRPSRTIDVVSELAHVIVIGNLHVFFGVDDTPDQRLRGWLQTIGFYIFNFWMGGPYRAAAAKAGEDLTKHLRESVRARAAAPVRQGAEDVLDRMLLALGDPRPKPLPEDNEILLARTLGGLISGATVPTMGLFVQVVDKLLDLRDDQQQELCQASSSGTDETVWRYIQEAARFTTFPPLLYRHAFTPYVFCIDGKATRTIERGSLVVTAPFFANFDASVFRRPARFDPAREYDPADESRWPILFGWGQHQCLGMHMGKLLLTEMVKAIFSKDVRRVGGPDGRPTKGAAGDIPDGDFAQRLVVRFR